jgi:hypothetical protein
MLWEAQRMYGKALAGLRRSLGVPGGPVKDASIATVKLLAMFEVRARRATKMKRSGADNPV